MKKNNLFVILSIMIFLFCDISLAQAASSGVNGKILLKVEDSGKAYYVNPESEEMHYLGKPEDAFRVMREQGVGISNENLEKISIGLSASTGTDTDKDGLSDLLEDAIGTDKTLKDSDGDGHDDLKELASGYSPKAKNVKAVIDTKFSEKQKGKIFLQVEGKGEAWYVNPADGKRYFLGRPADAFQAMRGLSLGISNTNFDKLPNKISVFLPEAKENSEEASIIEKVKAFYDNESTVVETKKVLEKNVTHFRFSFKFPLKYSEEANVMLDFYIGEEKLATFDSGNYKEEVWHNSEFIPISKYAGQEVSLLFVISSNIKDEGGLLLDDLIFTEITPAN